MTLFSLILCSSWSYGQQFNNSAYYTSNIDKAVKDAERRPRNVYVGNRWYNRTTSKSFGLPKMLNKEMAGKHLEGALESTAAGTGIPEAKELTPDQLSEVNSPLRRTNDQTADDLNIVESKETNAIANGNKIVLEVEDGFKTNIDYIDYEVKTFGYNGSAHNIAAEGTLKATVNTE